MQTIIFKLHKENRKIWWTHSINNGWSKLCLLLLWSSTKISGMHLLYLQRDNSPSTILYMYIWQVILTIYRVLNQKYSSNNDTWKRLNTKLEEEFSLLTIVNELSVQPNACNKDSSATKGFWVLLLQRFLKIYHQHNFALQDWLY